MNRWLSSLSGQVPLAVITASSVNALSFARSLGRLGIPVLILDSDRHLAVHTRFAKVMSLPNVSQGRQAWIDALLDIGRRLESRAVLIPTADPHVVLIAEHQAELETYFSFLVPDAQLARQFVSKQFQLQHAREMGVPVPESHFPDSREELESLADKLKYPRILKPDRSHSGAKLLAGQKLLVVQSASELLDAWKGLAVENTDCLVQEIIPGPDTELVSYLGFWNKDGVETAFITKRKLRQFPALFGNGSIQVTEDLPEVTEMSRRLLVGLNYRGFASIEFKFDRRDGSYRFVEINPRSSAMNELAVKAGVDFPSIAYRCLSGEDVQPQADGAFQTGLRCVNEEWDLQAYWELRGKGEMSFLQWCGSLRGSHRMITAWDDPKPILAGVARAFLKPFQGRSQS